MKRLGQRAALVGFGSVVALALAEVLLRVTWVPWPVELWNYMASCYESDAPSPINYLARHLGAPLARPNVETRCGFNRRTWRHRSDRFGARGPADRDGAEVAILGDSMVYGHAIEEEDTAAHLLGEKLRKRVANLGIFGACPVQYLWQVENLVGRLRPRVVVVFYYRNDFHDILALRPPKRIREFVDGGAAAETDVVAPGALFKGATDRRSALARAASKSFVYRAARFYWFLIARGPKRKDEGGLSRADFDLAIQYMTAAAREMKKALASSGSTLVVAYMPTDARPGSGAERAGKLMHRVTADLAREVDVPYFDPTEALSLPDGRPDPAGFLEGDWHLSPVGNRRLADALADFISGRRMLE